PTLGQAVDSALVVAIERGSRAFAKTVHDGADGLAEWAGVTGGGGVRQMMVECGGRQSSRGFVPRLLGSQRIGRGMPAEGVAKAQALRGHRQTHALRFQKIAIDAPFSRARSSFRNERGE